MKRTNPLFESLRTALKVQRFGYNLLFYTTMFANKYIWRSASDSLLWLKKLTENCPNCIRLRNEGMRSHVKNFILQK